MEKGYKISNSNTDAYIWKIPKKALEKLGFNKDAQIKLLCGNKAVTAVVSSFSSTESKSAGEDKIFLSDKCAEALSIPYHLCMMLKKEKPRQIRLGPVIGLLTFPGYVPGRLNLYKTYALMMQSSGLFYVFKSDGINMKKKTIQGYTYNPSDKSWTLRELPFPDVVIDRRYPNSGRTHTLLEKEMGTGKIFNKRTMITKIDFERTIRKNKVLAGYLPETKILRSVADVNCFIKKYGRAILKPVNAMKGIGIIILTKEKNKYKCSYNSHGENVTAWLDSISEIFDLIKTVSGRWRPYVVQQLIETMKYKNSTFSFRTCPMKNGKGEWVMPGMLVLGLGNGVVTNYSSGGKSISLRNLFQDIQSRLTVTPKKLIDHLTNLSFQVAETLDQKYGPLGELGIDIILDTTGRPWLLEANGNPGTGPIFYQKEFPDWPAQLYKYPLEYACYISGFTPSNDNVLSCKYKTPLN